MTEYTTLKQRFFHAISASHTRYMFRLRKGVYLVHPDALNAEIEAIINEHMNNQVPDIEEECECYVVVEICALKTEQT